MIRKIIHIDTEKCNGCGACAAACHEGAIGMGKRQGEAHAGRLCDGWGLPARMSHWCDYVCGAEAAA